MLPAVHTQQVYRLIAKRIVINREQKAEAVLETVSFIQQQGPATSQGSPASSPVAVACTRALRSCKS